jgi:hypothetical protein
MSNPSVIDILRRSTAGPDAPPPPVQGVEPEVAAQVDGVHFPNLELNGGFEWKAIGGRSDRLDGRITWTVFYEHEEDLVGYTIVGGSPLETPADAEPRREHGVDVALLRDEHGHDVAMFERDGRTCLISGYVEERSTLVRLATWKEEEVVG